DLALDPVAILVGHPRLAVPATAVEFLEGGGVHSHFPRIASGRGHAAHGDLHLHAVDHEHVAAGGAPLHVRGDVAVLGVDVVDVAVGRLGDVGIRRNRLVGQRLDLVVLGGRHV